VVIIIIGGGASSVRADFRKRESGIIWETFHYLRRRAMWRINSRGREKG